MDGPNNDSAEPMYLSHSFTELVEGETELAELRRGYAVRSRKERMQAADWNYQSALATGLLSRALASAGQAGIGARGWPDGYVALAIAPDYAPALLTVGSIEYELARNNLARLRKTLERNDPGSHETGKTAPE
jgi:hypothetical protein